MSEKVQVPWFDSLLGSSQREEPQPDQTVDRTPQTKSPSRHQSGKRGNKMGHVRVGKKRFLLKVNLQKVNRTLNKKVDNTPGRWTGEPATNYTKTTVSRQGAATASDSVVRDVFFFSQRPTSTAKNEKEEAKLAVLRTISKMLKQNQLIRQRLATVSRGCTD
ncbi:hypothetical protein VZT92_023178 [Zoarces viviparus]|uniref:Uncharacterized protein n=1 Tax=Zoarces viviparus TaxID=48416 RepID=A0AAW1E6G0_ZOAVI